MNDDADLMEIDDLWERRSALSTGDKAAVAVLERVLDRLESGSLRSAEMDSVSDSMRFAESVRRGILLTFKVFDLIESADKTFYHRDRIPLRTSIPGCRVVPGAVVRRGSYLGPQTVLMPSFVNIGAYIGAETMIDTWATVGSCAQVGRKVHIAGGAGIGGVLEPATAAPVVIEDEAFVGSRAVVVEGARVRTGAKLGAGAVLTGSTRVFDAETGAELSRGEAPAWSVCVGSNRVTELAGGQFTTRCLLVIRRLESGERYDKLAIEDWFRDHV